MRLVVLDTNVIVSAGIKPQGAPGKLIMDWVLEGQVQVVTSPLIVEEYREIAQRPKFYRYGFPLWLEFLVEESLHLHDSGSWLHAVPDPKGLPFLGLARAAGAWLVIGNLRHFPVAACRPVKVLSPTDYLTHLMESTNAAL